MFSEQVRERIRQSGLTHYELGRRANIAPEVIRRFAVGERGLSTVVLDRLLPALDLELVSKISARAARPQE